MSAHHHITDERRLFWAMLLTGSFMIAEVAGGLVSGSLALLADAAHMLTDMLALGLAWVAAKVARRPADRLRSYGYHRVQIISALVNGLAAVGLVLWILYEAIHRLFNPLEVMGDVMLVIAVLGLVVNAIVFQILHQGGERNLNIRAALIHVLGDMLGSVAAIIAGIVIVTLGWTLIDPLLSCFIALIIFRSAWKVIGQSIHILLEGAPDELDVEVIRTTLINGIPAVCDVHHVHLWSLTPEQPVLTMHVTVAAGTDTDTALAHVKMMLASRFAIAHSTVQIEQHCCADAQRGDPGFCQAPHA
ncbi:MAG: cation diffusion facilitator family transporter [Pseudomonadota bacterium]